MNPYTIKTMVITNVEYFLRIDVTVMAESKFSEDRMVSSSKKKRNYRWLISATAD